MSPLDFVCSNLDNGSVVALIFFDFNKTFDYLDLSDRFANVELFGIRVAANGWFEPCSTNGYQDVSVEDVDSRINLISYVVHRDSMWGPPMFHIFINDLPSYIKKILNFHYFLMAARYSVGFLNLTSLE